MLRGRPTLPDDGTRTTAKTPCLISLSTVRGAMPRRSPASVVVNSRRFALLRFELDTIYSPRAMGADAPTGCLGPLGMAYATGKIGLSEFSPSLLRH